MPSLSEDSESSDSFSAFVRSARRFALAHAMEPLAHDPVRRALFGPDSSEESGPEPRRPVDLTGRSIGRYRVDERIGRGGMGEVYAAYDRVLDRRVAIKRSTVEGDPCRLDAMTTEARSVAKIRHNNVVAVHDVILSDGELLVVMELVPGPTLGRWLGDGRRSWREIVEVFIGAGEGLAAAHAEGIVHRDFKPSNVLMAPGRCPRVVDFGLARRIEGPPTSRREATVGTRKYMAPEQHSGSPVGPSADQFAYCNALYRALFGHAPFDDASPEAYVASVMEGRVRRPRARQGAPRVLERIVMRGLASSPQDRNPSMEQLVGMLRSLLLQRRRRAAVGGGILAVVVATLAARCVLGPGS